MKEQKKDSDKKASGFWLVFRAPESIIAFISGAFISTAINLFTGSQLDMYSAIAASIMVVVSLLLVLWTVCTKPLDDIYRGSKDIIDEEVKKDPRFSTEFWVGILNKNKKVKNTLLIVFITVLILTVAAVLFLVIPKFI